MRCILKKEKLINFAKTTGKTALKTTGKGVLAVAFLGASMFGLDQLAHNSAEKNLNKSKYTEIELSHQTTGKCSKSLGAYNFSFTVLDKNNQPVKGEICRSSILSKTKIVLF